MYTHTHTHQFAMLSDDLIASREWIWTLFLCVFAHPQYSLLMRYNYFKAFFTSLHSLLFIFYPTSSFQVHCHLFDHNSRLQLSLKRVKFGSSIDHPICVHKINKAVWISRLWLYLCPGLTEHSPMEASYRSEWECHRSNVWLSEHSVNAFLIKESFKSGFSVTSAAFRGRSVTLLMKTTPIYPDAGATVTETVFYHAHKHTRAHSFIESPLPP